jgi:RNA polymerase sigma factor (sigma-70 family)
MTPMSNEEMVIAYQDGDQSMLGRLLEANEFALRRIVGRHQQADWDDAMQEARIGFMRAALEYDRSRGIKFSTYFFLVVRRYVQRWKQRQRLIRLPHYLFGFGAGEDRIKSCVSCTTHGVDLGLTTWVKVDHEQPDSLMASREQASADEADFEARFGRLSQRQRFVISLRMKGLKLKEIGAMLGISRERVRQIEVKAMAQLRKK